MNKIKLGYLSNGYDYIRNIINKVDNCEYHRIIDIHRLSGRLLLYLEQKKIYQNQDLFTDILYGFNDFNLNKIDLFHFMNNVSYGKTPWISTFETVIPRFSPLLKNHENGMPQNDKKVLKGLESIASDSCKKIISMSQCSLNIQEKLLHAYPNYFNAIKEKMCVMHPPQELFFTDIKQKELPSELTFIFVGGYFFQKGGLEILETFTKVRKKLKINIKLIIISKMLTDAVTQSGKNELERTQHLINSNSDWIEYHKGLPNSEVLNLMKKSHIGLLPTWADTYGYSVLEMQATGCSVITTDVRALPEINTNERGWVINLPKNSYGEALYQTEKSRNEIRNTIKNQLEKILIDIINNQQQITQKANKSLENIKQNHSLDNYSEKLQTIYKKALA